MSKTVNKLNFRLDRLEPVKLARAKRQCETKTSNKAATSNRNTVPTLLKALYLGVALGAVSVPAYACKIPKSYYSNVFCTADSNYFLALKDSGQPVALINKKGKRVADLMQYNAIDVGKLKDGLVPVQRLGRVGYINTSGVEVIPAVYQVISGNRETKGWARAVNDNRIVVKKNGKFGVIDIRNRTIVPFSSANQSISDFKNNKAFITTAKGKKWIDLNGNPVADPTVATSKPAAKATSSKPASKVASSVQTDSTDEKITASVPQQTQSSEVWTAEKQEDKWGFVDSNNVPMIKFLFDQVTPFSEGLAGVRMEDKWGFVNLAGELVIPFDFKESEVNREDSPAYKGKQPFEFIEGKSWVANTESGAKICIDTKGQYVKCSIPTVEVDSSKPAAEVDNSKPADPTDEKVAVSVPQQTQSGSTQDSLSTPNTVTQPTTADQSFNASNSEVKEAWTAAKQENKWGFVDSNNVPMIKFIYDQVTPFSEGLAGVRMEDKWGFINLAGKLVIPFDFKESEVNREEDPAYKGKQPFEFIEGKSWVANTESGAKICIDTKGQYVKCSIPTGEVANSKPESEVTRSIPADEVDNSRPAVEVDNSKPAVEVDNSKPADEVDNSRPADEVDNSKPAAEVDNSKPAVEVDSSKPAAEVASSSKPVAEVDISIPPDPTDEMISVNVPQQTQSGAAQDSLSTPNTVTQLTTSNQGVNDSNSEVKEVWTAAQQEGKWGFVDSSNVPMIKFIYDQVTPFSEGLAGVRMEDKWGFVNLAGELVIPFDYKESEVNREDGPAYKGKQPFEFIEGKSWVANTESGAKICIDTKGKYVNCS